MILLVIIFLLIGVNYFLSRVDITRKNNREIFRKSLVESEKQLIKTSINLTDDTDTDLTDIPSVEKENLYDVKEGLFNFDPNETTINEWKNGTKWTANARKKPKIPSI